MSKSPVPKQLKTDTSYSTFFNKSIGEIPDSKWRELIDTQDYDTLIFDIREDLLTQVADECHKRYLNREVYKFLIECAHKAFRRIITLHFYIYDDSHKYAPSLESWTPDEEPQVCKPDSWAKGNIPYSAEELPQHKLQQTDLTHSGYNLVRCEYPTTNVFDDSSARVEPEFAEEEQSPFSVEQREASSAVEMSQTNVQFEHTYTINNDDTYNLNSNVYDLKSNSNEMLPHVHDLANRIASENTFYKIMKVGLVSNISLQSKRPKPIMPPAWTNIDDIRADHNRHESTASRYLHMRRECLATIERSKPTSKK